MIVRWGIVLPLVLALGFSGVYAIQTDLDGMRERGFDEELLYLPNEYLLTHFTGGMSSVVANLLWLRCIQYTTETFREQRKLEWLEHMSHTITRLDPHFTDVYRYGGIFLAALQADDDASIELLKKGMPHNPDRWELPQEAAMVYLLNRREQPGSAEMGAQYLAMAVATGKAPEHVTTFAQNLQIKHNLPEVERAMWMDAYNHSSDEFMRDLAERKLQELDVREICEALTQVVSAYAAAMGYTPGDFHVLARAGYLLEPPGDMLGGQFLIASDGAVQHTVLLDDLAERRANHIRAGLRRFERARGYYPESLEVLQDSDAMAAIPPHPYDDREWGYDPASGEVTP